MVRISFCRIFRVVEHVFWTFFKHEFKIIYRYAFPKRNRRCSTDERRVLVFWTGVFVFGRTPGWCATITARYRTRSLERARVFRSLLLLSICSPSDKTRLHVFYAFLINRNRRVAPIRIPIALPVSCPVTYRGRIIRIPPWRYALKNIKKTRRREIPAAT